MAKGWALFLAGLGLVLGGVAGFFFAIHMNPETADRYVLDLGSVGEWFSGLGAFAAVVTALVIADKQRRDNAEKVLLSCRLVSAIDGTELYDAKDLVIEVVSAGNRPVRLQSAKIWANPGESGYRISSAGAAGAGFPIELNYGENTDIRLEFQRAKDVCDYFQKEHGGDFSSARITVCSTLGSWELSIARQLVEWKALRANK